MTTTEVHISTINIGDIVIHNGKMKTVCRRVFGYSSFMGTTLWGDSYRLGYKQVLKVIL